MNYYELFVEPFPYKLTTALPKPYLDRSAHYVEAVFHEIIRLLQFQEYSSYLIRAQVSKPYL